MNRFAATPRRLPTRLVLALILATGLVAACGDKGDSAALTPVEIGRDTACELDGMLLADYPGPKGQILYAGADAPAFFCDTTELLSTLLAGEQVRAVRAAYVQDMAKADWSQPQGYWIDAKTAIYVTGSKRHGSMGPTIASFAEEAAAQQFSKEYGGKVLRFAEIKADMVDLRGGALHDSHM
ncbi:MAG TPA: nitrous oxide reductase accessory protein NosL [Rhodocyclaceae bacterium]|nr:nitrous oxide reductase accessory protein NosL [Rhodocyclaceae bacterium]